MELAFGVKGQAAEGRKGQISWYQFAERGEGSTNYGTASAFMAKTKQEKEGQV
jgi:hypothetical protein